MKGDGGGERDLGKGRSMALATGITLALMALLAVVGAMGDIALSDMSTRSRAVGKIGGALVAELIVLASCAMWARRRAVRLLEHLAWEPGGVRAWIFVAVIWGLWCLPILIMPRQGVEVFEPSLFNVGGSLLAGPGAGVAEELIFRGVVIALLARAQWGPVGQVMISALLFGLSHVGWGSLARGPVAVLMPVLGTTALGALMGVTYLLAGRKLMPAMVFHAGINMVIEPWLVLAAVEGRLIMPGA